ncbi:MAG: hypothetical protein ACQKBT_13165 [Puniceicoccales bacterium]
MKLRTHSIFLMIAMLAGSLWTLHGADAGAEGASISPEEIAENQTEWMVKSLDLDEATEEAVHEINLDFVSAAKAVANSDGSRFSRMRELKELMEEKDEDLKAVLTSSQFESYKKLQKERRNEQKETLKSLRESNL